MQGDEDPSESNKEIQFQHLSAKSNLHISKNVFVIHEFFLKILVLVFSHLYNINSKGCELQIFYILKDTQ